MDQSICIILLASLTFCCCADASIQVTGDEKLDVAFAKPTSVPKLLETALSLAKDCGGSGTSCLGKFLCEVPIVKTHAGEPKADVSITVKGDGLKIFTDIDDKIKLNVNVGVEFKQSTVKGDGLKIFTDIDDKIKLNVNVGVEFKIPKANIVLFRLDLAVRSELISAQISNGVAELRGSAPVPTSIVASGYHGTDLREPVRRIMDQLQEVRSANDDVAKALADFLNGLSPDLGKDQLMYFTKGNAAGCKNGLYRIRLAFEPKMQAKLTKGEEQQLVNGLFKVFA